MMVDFNPFDPNTYKDEGDPTLGIPEGVEVKIKKAAALIADEMKSHGGGDAEYYRQLLTDAYKASAKIVPPDSATSGNIGYYQAQLEIVYRALLEYRTPQELRLWIQRAEEYLKKFEAREKHLRRLDTGEPSQQPEKASSYALEPKLGDIEAQMTSLETLSAQELEELLAKVNEFQGAITQELFRRLPENQDKSQ